MFNGAQGNQQDLSNTSGQQGSSGQATGQVRAEPVKQPVVGSSQPVSGRPEQKEAPVSRPEVEIEKVPITEVKEPGLSKEVEGWVEKLEKGEDVVLKKPVTDDYGKILVEASVKQKPKIVLPLDEREVEQGQKHKVVDSIRWLAEWCLRVIKLAGGRVFYRK